jgi:ABC-type nickel/cobalt efflux system permease component RcnA
MLVSLLALGFLLGLKHALEADHIAAVTSLVTRSASLRETIRVSGAWGIGHAATMIVFGTVLILLGATLPKSVALALEAAVGIMLVVLGVDVLRRLSRKQIHLHAHAHGHGVSHIHVHMHEREPSRHEHAHAAALWPRALIVGCMHGLAGTAGLVLLALPTMKSGVSALGYLFVFGTGTVFGMILFSLAISVPLAMSVKRLRWAAYTLEALVGTANVILGGWIAVRSLS